MTHSPRSPAFPFRRTAFAVAGFFLLSACQQDVLKDGIKQGMAKKEVAELLKGLGLVVSDQGAHTLIATALDNTKEYGKDGKVYAVYFCKGQATGVQKFLKPGTEEYADQLSKLSDEFAAVGLDVQPPVDDKTGRVFYITHTFQSKERFSFLNASFDFTGQFTNGVVSSMWMFYGDSECGR